MNSSECNLETSLSSKVRPAGRSGAQTRESQSQRPGQPSPGRSAGPIASLRVTFPIQTVGMARAPTLKNSDKD